MHNILNGQPEWQKAGILDLDPVIKYSNADGRSLLSVVRMHDGVHERLPNRNQRNRPAVLPADALYGRFVRQMPVCECNRFFRGARQERADLR